MGKLLDALKQKPTTWILAVAILVMAAQNAGLLGRVADVFGGDGGSQARQDVRETKEAMQKHAEQSVEMNNKLGQVIEQNGRMEWYLRKTQETNATGFRVLCMQRATTASERRECAEIK